MYEHMPMEEVVAKAKAHDRAAFDELARRLRPRLERQVQARMGARVRSQVEVEDIVQETFLRAWETVGRLEWRGEEAFGHWLGTVAEHLIWREARSAARATLELGQPGRAGSDPSGRGRADLDPGDSDRAHPGDARPGRPFPEGVCPDEACADEPHQEGAHRDEVFSNAARPEPVLPRLPRLELDGDPPADVPSAARLLTRTERTRRLERALSSLSRDHREVIVLARIDRLSAAEIADRMGRSENAVKKLLGRALLELKRQFGNTTGSLRLGDLPLRTGGARHDD